MVRCHHGHVGVVEKAMEEAAGDIVSSHFGGVAVPRDVPGGPPGLHDFDVRVGSTTVASVEVTSIQVGKARATQSWFTKLRDRDIGLSSQRSMAPITKAAAEILNSLERLGVMAFMGAGEQTDPHIQTLVGQANQIGIVSAFMMSQASPPRLYCGGFGSNAFRPEAATDAVESEAQKPDNLRKLGCVAAGIERHLFVWAHHSAWEVASLLLDSRTTLPVISLPIEIDIVWLAPGVPSWTRPERVLRAERASGGRWTIP